MKSTNFMDKLIPENENGIPIKDCQPYVVFARAIEIDSEINESKSINRRDSKYINAQIVRFEFEIDGKKYTAKQTFHIGDVSPELGQWARGVVVQCQWFSMNFVMTHLMKPKGK